MLAEAIHSFAGCASQGLLFFGLKEMKKKPDTEHPLGYGKEIKEYLETRQEIDRVLNMITLQLGSQIMLAVKAKMAKADSFDQLIANINRCESESKKEFPEIQWAFFEPDNKK
jgi:divalent metal cation (Fe/Co/Zn/Cd) transporter